ncbi:MAG: Co2+/Mg2+ efflux protein ApaG [Rhodobiaceae bacterium]|nr:Co2+/Mg2+ efflux protein ApaG [Rhodobiaceae bacterium]MCC0053961.1 Co2+/Mg2+ efflux protein ApaG [Rhodobiaceae bacterium]
MTFRAVTHGFEVSAEPTYCRERSQPEDNRHFWTYTITIRNGGGEPAQLVARHWDIVDERGQRQVVDGPGVVGEQPVLAPGESFRYTSGVPLTTPSGMMRGHYRMRASGGREFDIAIPAFSLDSPNMNRRAN